MDVKKTTVMGNVVKVNSFSDGEDISTVTNCMFWWFASSMTATAIKRSGKEQSSNDKFNKNHFKKLEVPTNTTVRLLQYTTAPLHYFHTFTTTVDVTQHTNISSSNPMNIGTVNSK